VKGEGKQRVRSSSSELKIGNANEEKVDQPSITSHLQELPKSKGHEKNKTAVGLYIHLQGLGNPLQL